MKIEIRPPEGVMVIGEIHSDYMMFHLCCDDGLENNIDIVLSQEQMNELKKSINQRKDIKLGEQGK